MRLRAKKSRLLAPQVYLGGRGRFCVHESLGKLPRSADLVELSPRLFLFSLALHSCASALQDVKNQHSHCSLNELHLDAPAWLVIHGGLATSSVFKILQGVSMDARMVFINLANLLPSHCGGGQPGMRTLQWPS